MARGRRGILIKAKNGTVIGYDETGLSMRLSDNTVQDIAARIVTTSDQQQVPTHVLGDIDAWSVRQQGSWLSFDAKLPAYDESRRFRRHIARRGIIAEPPGYLLGLLSLGGPQLCDHHGPDFQFPAHVVTEDDDIGVVGMGGIEEAPLAGRPTPARHSTLDSLTADALVGCRRAGGKALPVVFTRCETDGAPGIDAFATGRAVSNFERALDNFLEAAKNLGQKPRLLPIGIDYCDEDILSAPGEFLTGLYSLLDRVKEAVTARGLGHPGFLMSFPENPDRTQAFDTLALFGGQHDIVFTGPSGRFARDRFGRRTPAAMRAEANLRARAIDTLLDGDRWYCPRLILAEATAPQTIRVTCQSDGPLAFDESAGAIKSSGVSVMIDGKPKSIAKLSICENDPKAFEVKLKVKKIGGDVVLGYGLDGLFGLREDTDEGQDTYKWALPARLKVTGC